MLDQHATDRVQAQLGDGDVTRGDRVPVALQDLVGRLVLGDVHVEHPVGVQGEVWQRRRVVGQARQTVPMTFDLARIGAGLPIAAAVGDLEAALTSADGCGVAVVQAPPGTGKTTLVPPLVANLLASSGLDGRVIVTQPRRIAARAGARRLAHLSGERLGGAVGFTVRGESRTSRDTAVEFVTTGVLVRRLLNDAELADVGAVVLDEVHERHLDSDLCFAMLCELRELRPELGIVVMSATLDASRWAELLGDDEPAPVVAVEADLHPLEVRWAPLPPGGQRLDARGVTPAFLDHVVSTTASAFAAAQGNALVFLPGAREVSRVAEGLRARGLVADELFGQVDGRAQDDVMREGGERRIIVSTAVAESSLTVPGVRLVVDAGLAREPRFDSGRGMSGLVTVSEARSSAQQRAGRAARLGPGTVVRCFPESDWARLRDFTTPEVQTADLTQATLDLACWGSPGGDGLRLPDPLPATALALANATLRGLGALDDDGRATAVGRAMARIPADPRLARALLVGAPVVGARAAAEVVALLSGDERAPGGDLEALLREMRRGRGPAASRWKAEADRLERLAATGSAGRGGGSADRGGGSDGGGGGSAGGAGDSAGTNVLGLVVALAHPDRIARRRGDSASTSYLLTGGTGVALDRGSWLKGSEWLAVAEMGRAHTADGTGAVVRAAVPITREVAEQAAEHLRRHEIRAVWANGRVTAREVDALGAVELTASPIAAPPEAARAAVLEALASQGIGLDAPGLFIWSDDARQLRNRLALLHHVLGDPWPDVSSSALLASAGTWLGPDLDRLAHGTSASRIDLVAALRRLLPWPAAGRLDEFAPQRLAAPSGSHVTITYPDDPSERVVLPVKLQECFGMLDTPRLVDGRVRVLMHLLSPARRPLAVTDDLASFWSNAYGAVRAENRGRYPKHPWPEDPLTAPPRRGTTRSGV